MVILWCTFMEHETIQVKIKLYAFLREILGKREITIALKPNSSPLDAILKLDELTNGKISEIILEDKRRLKENYVILVNGRKVDHSRIDSLNLEQGDEVVIFPPTSGGLL